MDRLNEDLIDQLWAEGFRPYEIYVFNRETVTYCGNECAPGTVAGWGIEFVFSTREKLKTYPFFDAVIGVDSLANDEIKFWI